VGELVDALKSKGRAFTVGGVELHLFVQPEAANDGARLSGESSIFILRFAGLRDAGPI